MTLKKIIPNSSTAFNGNLGWTELSAGASASGVSQSYVDSVSSSLATADTSLANDTVALSSATMSAITSQAQQVTELSSAASSAVSSLSSTVAAVQPSSELWTASSNVDGNATTIVPVDSTTKLFGTTTANALGYPDNDGTVISGVENNGGLHTVTGMGEGFNGSNLASINIDTNNYLTGVPSSTQVENMITLDATANHAAGGTSLTYNSATQSITLGGAQAGFTIGTSSAALFLRVGNADIFRISQSQTGVTTVTMNAAVQAAFKTALGI